MKEDAANAISGLQWGGGPDNIYRGVYCKHVHAIKISRRMREAVQQEVPKTVIKQVDPTKCKYCDSPHISKKGTRTFKKGVIQQYK